MNQPTLFDFDDTHTVEHISQPKTYKGIYAFHKYWGKKPVESLDYCIERCTEKNDIVLDPFLGSGLISKETHNLDRRFLGIDINPFSIEHTLFLLSLPKPNEYKNAVQYIKKNVFSKISESYTMQDGSIASHYLWDKDILEEVWTKDRCTKKKLRFSPTTHDADKITEFQNYTVRNIQKGTFFENARINASETMSVYDLFTNRALYNMDLLLDEINTFSGDLKRALLLTLTSAPLFMSSSAISVQPLSIAHIKAVKP